MFTTINYPFSCITKLLVVCLARYMNQIAINKHFFLTIITKFLVVKLTKHK